MLHISVHQTSLNRKCFLLRERSFALHRPEPDRVTRWRSLCMSAYCARFAIARDARPGKRDWKRLLRRYAGQVLKSCPVFHYPPRRFPTLIAQQPLWSLIWCLSPGGNAPARYGPQRPELTISRRQTPVNSPIKYHGRKHNRADWIIRLAARHKHWVEPYGGGLSMTLAKDPTDVSEVVNDINGQLMSFWRVLQEPGAFKNFVRRIVATPFSQSEWEAATP
jgi:hypothetical protein